MSSAVQMWSKKNYKWEKDYFSHEVLPRIIEINQSAAF